MKKSKLTVQILFLATFLISFLILISNNSYATESTTTTTITPQYTTITSIKGDRITDSRETDNLAMLIVEDDSLAVSNPTGSVGTNARVYYTTDGINFSESNILEFMNNNCIEDAWRGWGMNNLNNEYVSFDKIIVYNNYFYILVNICGGAAEEWHTMVKTNDGINFTKVTLPLGMLNVEINPARITKYEDTYIFADKYWGENDNEFTYYTTTDFITWTKRTIPNVDFSNQIDYTHMEYTPAVFDDGIVFFYTKRDDDVETYKTYATSDFITYTVLDETNIMDEGAIHGNRRCIYTK